MTGTGQQGDRRTALAHAGALAEAGRTEDALRRGRLGQAIKRLAKVVAAAPDPTARTHLGIALAEAGRTEEALTELCRAAPYPPALCNLGVALLHQGKHEEAAAALRRAVTVQPDYAKAWFELGVALQERDPAHALACYREVLARAPGHGDALYNSAILLQAHGDFRAAAHYEACLAQAHARAGAWLALGFCRPECGDVAAALEAYRAALRQDAKLYPAGAEEPGHGVQRHAVVVEASISWGRGVAPTLLSAVLRSVSPLCRHRGGV